MQLSMKIKNKLAWIKMWLVNYEIANLTFSKYLLSTCYVLGTAIDARKQ